MKFIMTMETLFYTILTVNIAVDLFFFLHESLYERTVFQKVIPDIKPYAPREYDWERELDYRKTNRKFGVLSSIIGYIATVIIFRAGLFSKIMIFLHTRFPSPFWTGFTFALILTLCLFLYRMPFSFYHSFVLEEKYGFNRKTLPVFIKDNLVSLLLSLAILPIMTGSVNYLSGLEYGIPLIFLCVVCFSLIFSFLFPILIMPLFYKITPLEKAELREKVQELIDKTGLPVKGIFTADQSRRSSHSNAMVAGFGKSRKIILFDTLIEKMEMDETLSVLAHEMGHCKERHVLISLAVGIFEQALLFALLWYMWNSPITQTMFGITGMTLARLVIILFILSGIMSLVLSPIESFISRELEFRADRFASQQTSPDHFARALSNLATNDLAWVPSSYLYSLWFSSHPSIPERILHIHGPEEPSLFLSG